MQKITHAFQVPEEKVCTGYQIPVRMSPRITSPSFRHTVRNGDPPAMHYEIAMKSLALKSTTLLWATTLSGLVYGIDVNPAHFWLSTSPISPSGPEAPEIFINIGEPGRLYVWGRPQTTATSSSVFDNLTSFSLNLVTKGPTTGSHPIDFVDGQFTVFNDDLENHRFEYVRDSTADECYTTYCILPELLSEVEPVSSGLTKDDRLLNLAGFSFFFIPTDPPATGIGGECHEEDLCFRADDGKDAWLIASVGFEAIDTGQTEVFLQVGEDGMSHQSKDSNLTNVRFGISEVPGSEEPPYNASTQRNCTFPDCVCPAGGCSAADSPDATIHSFLAGDFDENKKVEAGDLSEWKTQYGTSVVEFPGGDYNGIVDGGDFLIWQRNVGRSIPPISAATRVPEPQADFMIVVFAALLWPRAVRCCNNSSTLFSLSHSS